MKLLNSFQTIRVRILIVLLLLIRFIMQIYRAVFSQFDCRTVDVSSLVATVANDAGGMYGR